MQLILKIWLKMLMVWWQLSVPIRLRSIGVKLGENLRFYGMPTVTLAEKSRIYIGDRVTLCSDSRFTALGVNHPVILRTLRPGSEISIGADTGISGGSICAAVRVRLGRECLLGANVIIADTDFHAIKLDGRRFNNNHQDIAASPVSVEDNVFIGTGTVILKGVTVGEGVVIGANSVVSKSLPAGFMAAGSPAKVIKKIPSEIV